MEPLAPIQTTGHVRRTELVGADALGQVIAFDVEIGRPADDRGLSAGVWTMSLDTARALLAQILEAFEEIEASAPTKQ